MEIAPMARVCRVHHASPLKRVTKEKPAGSDFRQHPKEYFYEVNGASEVRDFVKTGGGYYPVNTLLKNTVKDENGNTVITYTDKLGRTVMTNHTGARTYYLYDDFGNILRVITPEGAKLGHNNSALLYTDSNIAAKSYQYTYDARQRLSTKIVPGANAYTYHYDRLDRPVLTIDGNSFKTFTKYDILGRPILTGKYTGSGTPGAETLYESKSTSGHYYTTTQAFPTTGTEIYTVSYYDSYDFDNNGTANEAYTAPDAVVASYYNEPVYLYVRGKVTGTKVGILKQDGTAPTQFLGTYPFYDKRSRIIQTKADNHLSGQDVTWNQYNFPGWLLRSRRKHTSTIFSVAKGYTINQLFNYHHTGRLLETYHKMGDGAGDGQLLARQSYTEKDELKQKLLHNTSGSNFLQTVDYKYNIRGWLTDINDFSTTADLFATKLTYGNGDPNLRPNYTGGANSSWNGNITMQEWKVKNHTDRHIYGYFYDTKDRITWSYYSNRNQSTQAYDYCDCYTSGYAYDDNGNITRSTNNGLVTPGNPYEWIDELLYTYTANGQLSQLQETKNATKGFATQATGVGGIYTAMYTYDNNGNMTADNHKKITIAYNHLNLPKKVTYVGGSWIEWTYDATGRKLNKTSSAGAYRNYMDGIEHTGSVLDGIYTSEGRVVLDGTNYRYEYSIKDHLGNGRVYFSDTNGDNAADILQESHPYAFGMETEAAYYAGQVGNENNYKYNGKELNEDFGLNWYDYGARWYMPDIGRWGSVDPMAEKYYSISSYSYVANNPLIFIDPTGAVIEDPIYNKRGKLIGDDGKTKGKIHIAFKNKEAKVIKKETKAGNTAIDLTGKQVVALNGGEKTVNGVISSVEAQNKDTSPGAGDAGLHEEGGHTEIDGSGNITSVAWKPGAKKGVTSNGSIDLFNGVLKPSSSELADYWHVHTSKTQEVEQTDGTIRTYRGSMTPSGSATGTDGDIGAARYLENSGYNATAIQVGTSAGTKVNFYNGQGVISSMSYKNFKKLKN